jgi:pyruvate dehydrogenase E2 component (dihydrolipoamide acetyltransferase)
VKVGTVIALLAGEGEDGGAAAAPAPSAPTDQPTSPRPAQAEPVEAHAPALPASAATGPSTSSGRADVSSGARSDRIIASPLAKRIAEQKGVDLTSLKGSGPNGRIVKADVEGAPVQDFAAEAGITANNASVRVFRAREALRKQVKTSCGTCADHGCLECSCGKKKPAAAAQHH